MAFVEIEQKYRVRDPDIVRRKLKMLHARCIQSGGERNEFFDFRGLLRKKKIALRLRRCQNGQSFLTLKGPPLRHPYSKRLELELPVPYLKTKALLRRLGFRAAHVYQKRIREEFKVGLSKICLDHIPKLGWFLEIEGATGQISRLERKLGFRISDREKRSYLQMLFKRHPLARRRKSD